MVHDGPWTDEQDDFLIAVRTKFPNLKWENIRVEFMVEFHYQGQPVETPVKDISSRYHVKLKKEARAAAYGNYLATGEMNEEHQAFIVKAERIVARFSSTANDD